MHECGVCKTIREGDPSEFVFEDKYFHIRHAGKPYGVAGWMMLMSKDHYPGPWAFPDDMALRLGPTIKQLTNQLIEVTGALRIYTAWMGESWPHFHAHMVPKYAQTPNDVKAWGVFDLQRAAQANEIVVDPDEVRRMTNELKRKY